VSQTEKPIIVDEFHKHELMDRAHFVNQILELLEDHPAHTAETKQAYEAAQTAVFKFYQVAAANHL
jgi:hypothetical protein